MRGEGGGCQRDVITSIQSATMPKSLVSTAFIAQTAADIPIANMLKSLICWSMILFPAYHMQKAQPSSVSRSLPERFDPIGKSGHVGNLWDAAPAPERQKANG